MFFSNLNFILNFGFTEKWIKLERMVNQFMNVKVSPFCFRCCLETHMPIPLPKEDGEGRFPVVPKLGRVSISKLRFKQGVKGVSGRF